VAKALGGADVVEMTRPDHLQRRRDMRALLAAGRSFGVAQGVPGDRVDDEFAHVVLLPSIGAMMDMRDDASVKWR
jgi:hypothetical protein